MKALVTGATGFVGSYLLESLLAHSVESVALIRDNSFLNNIEHLKVEKRTGEVRQLSSLETAFKNIDVVFHGVAQISDWGNWESYYSLTVEGTRNVIEASYKNNVKKVVLISSIASYGARFFSNKSLDEKSDYEHSIYFPWDYYCKSKRLAEDVTQELCNKYGVKYTIYRPGMSFGSRPNVILTRAFEHAKKNNPLVLVGGGNNKLQLNYIFNLVDAIVETAFDPKSDNNIFNICEEPKLTQKEFYKILLSKIGADKKIIKVPYSICLIISFFFEALYRLKDSEKRPPLTMWSTYLMGNNNHISSEKLRNTFRWTPKFAFEDGLNVTLNNIK